MCKQYKINIDITVILIRKYKSTIVTLFREHSTSMRFLCACVCHPSSTGQYKAPL